MPGKADAEEVAAGYLVDIRPPDAFFADPKQATLYDFFDGDRSDLDLCVSIAEEGAAHNIVDLGCGTGSLALLLAARGKSVIGVDPARASVDVARTKLGADRVRWIVGDPTALRDIGADTDLVAMTGNVAQVFVSDDDWSATLAAIRACLRPGGWLVFETRRPEARAWEEWDVPPTAIVLPDGRSAAFSRTVTEVDLPTVSFVGCIEIGDEVLVSESTLRFRDRTEIERKLARHGFHVMVLRDAPDRPGKEFVFLARRV